MRHNIAGRGVVSGAPVQPTAVVTGGAGGIGAAVCRRLAAGGAVVHALDLVEGTATDTTFHRVDVADEQECRRIMTEIGRVDILVNGAGIHPGFANSWEMPDGLFERVIAVNLAAAYYATRAVLAGMSARGWGRIVNVASIAARDGAGGSAAYAASKSGLLGLTRAMANETAGMGVLINCVLPASIDTHMLRSTGDPRSIVAGTPLKRLADPDEVAALVAWLCSDDCTYSTGAAYDVSGGRIVP
jgi:NAD(P)-dependent dehydrogenase (short-subunit alcohol dehydrogenase family)